MRSEVDLFGVFVPGLLCCGLIAFVLNMALRKGLSRTGFYQLVWHRALFDLAMFIVVLGGIVGLTNLMGWQ